MTDNERAGRNAKILHAVKWIVLLLLFFCFIFPFLMVIINVPVILLLAKPALDALKDYERLRKAEKQEKKARKEQTTDSE